MRADHVRPEEGIQHTSLHTNAVARTVKLWIAQPR